MDFSLTPEQAQLQAVARRFAYDELLPKSLSADAEHDPADCYSPELVERADELGLRTLKIPKQYGGHGASCLTEVLVLEELCAGDVGFGMSLQHGWREGHALAVHTTPAQRGRFLPDFLADPAYMTSLAITEEHFGSDSAGSSADPSAGPHTIARREGDEWVLDGRKRWITNANIARIAFVVARTDTEVPWREGCSVFLVPTDVAGYRTGRIEDKLGIRMNPNAEIILEGCRIPADNLLGELNQGTTMLARMNAGSKVKAATKALGIARAAYEEAVGYARQRIQGGTAIIRHQAVSSVLVEMEAAIEAVRSLIWRTAWSVDEGLPQSSRMEGLAKASASRMAVDVTTSALEIHGSYGIQRGRRIEKLMRDAAAILHTGVGNHALKSVLGAALADGCDEGPQFAPSGL